MPTLIETIRLSPDSTLKPGLERAWKENRTVMLVLHDGTTFFAVPYPGDGWQRKGTLASVPFFLPSQE